MSNSKTPTATQVAKDIREMTKQNVVIFAFGDDLEFRTMGSEGDVDWMSKGLSKEQAQRVAEAAERVEIFLRRPQILGLLKDAGRLGYIMAVTEKKGLPAFYCLDARKSLYGLQEPLRHATAGASYFVDDSDGIISVDVFAPPSESGEARNVGKYELEY